MQKLSTKRGNLAFENSQQYSTDEENLIKTPRRRYDPIE